MELEDISVASISANKLELAAQKVQIEVAKKANEQPKIAAQLILSATGAQEPGKGGLVDRVA